MSFLRKKRFYLEGDLPGSAAGRIYTDMAQRLLDEHGPRGVLLITSPDTGAGKTTTAANISLALLTKQVSVLLLELTETKPRMEEVFGISPYGRGMEDVLSGAKPLDAIVCKRIDNGLCLGMMKKQSSLNLNDDARRERLQGLLAYAKERCDWTVIDGPSHADADSLAALADLASQVTLVVGQRSTRRSRVTSALAQLEMHAPYVLMTS